jgi:hypothetical protein
VTPVEAPHALALAVVLACLALADGAGPTGSAAPN